MKLTNKLVCLMFLAWPLFASSAQATNQAGSSQAELGAGVVVSKVTKNSDAERAGLQEGDVIFSWSRENSGGQIDSPFDLLWLEIDQSPRGPVTVDGLRAGSKHSWTFTTDRWGVFARPSFPEKVLPIYAKADELSKAGKFSDASERLQALSNEFRNSPAWLNSWLGFNAALGLSEAKQWNESDQAYQEALRSAQSSGNARVSAVLLRGWARAYQQRRDWKSAEKYYLEALAESRKVGGDNLSVAANLNSAGIIAATVSELGRAQKYFQEMREVTEKAAPNSLAFAMAMNNLGNVAGSMGDFSKAEEYYTPALSIREKLIPGSSDVASTLNNLGTITYLRGDLAKTQDYFSRALAIQEKLSPGRADIGSTLTNLGNVALQRRDLINAEKYYRQALELEKKISNEPEMARALSSLGLVARHRGDLARAEDYHRQALVLEQKVGPETREVASTLLNLGNVSAERGDYGKAADYYQQALAIDEKVFPNQVDTALSLVSLGILAWQKKDLAKAEDYCKRALVVYEKIGSHSLDSALVTYTLGNIARDAGDTDKAAAYYKSSIETSEKQLPGGESYAGALSELARIKLQKHDLDGAAELFTRAIATLEQQTLQFGGTAENRAGFRATYVEAYKMYIDLLLEQKDTARAFQMLERSRARTLLEILSEGRVDIRRGMDPAVLQRERSLETDASAKAARRLQMLREKPTKEQLAALDADIQKTLVERKEVEEQIRSSSSAYAALTRPQPVSAAEVQQLLDDDTILLEYSLGNEHSYVFLVTPKKVAAYELPNRVEIEGVARRVYELLGRKDRLHAPQAPAAQAATASPADAEFKLAAAKLSHMLLGPVASELQSKRLLIVGDGAIQYIPFTALPAPRGANSTAEALVIDHEIINLPSASVLSVLRRQQSGREPAPKAVAVLADPVFTKDDPRVKGGDHSGKPAPASAEQRGQEADSSSADLLSRSAADFELGRGGELRLPRLLFSRQEAQEIMALTSRLESMEAVDFEANLATVTGQELGQYRTLHFATHGLLNSEHPELSGLVFSLVNQNGEPQNGFLTLQDVYNLNIRADLVVLSACETGLGKQINGEGLVGLTRGFMYAGATHVVASLWNVSDMATAKLMAQFYLAMLQKGMKPAAALRAAQVHILREKRWSSPYYWAGFQIQGDWK